MLAKDELNLLLQKCAEILQPVTSTEMTNALAYLEELVSKFQQLDGQSLNCSKHVFIIQVWYSIYY